MFNPDDLYPHYDQAGKDLILKAYKVAEEVLINETRGNGHPFIEHPIGVAQIVYDEIGLKAECVAAVYLHEATRCHPEISMKSFPKDVAIMAEGLNRISTIKPKDTRLEAENYKKLIVQYSADPRVTVIKIADRLEVMRNLSMFPKSSRDRKVLETLMLYIPLAHQLGLYNIKKELEDIYFKWADPQEYRSITNKLKATEKDRERLTSEFIVPLQAKIAAAGIKYKLKVRTKTAYSIYKKMQAQKVPFEGVYDVFAIRFIIDCDEDRDVEKDLCWKVYSYVTEEYTPDTSRLRDWLTKPKPNGYESLHITVRNNDGACIEVQIRTKRMDDIAENGHAAHWAYKGIKHEESIDSWLTSVRWSLEHPFETKEEDLPQPPSKEIFIFTPTGELRILPAGSTVLDFAFNIHSNIGVHCTGGRVNGKAVSFREHLQTGDVVEIMTGKNQKPSADWLNYVVTSKARGKIKLELNEEERKKSLDGRELLERRLKNWKLELSDALLHDYIKKHKIASINAFYAQIADETIDVYDVREWIQQGGAGYQVQESKETEEDFAAKAAKGSDDILVLNAKDVKGLVYNLAKCCSPVFGDDVFGFVTRTEGIKIHRISCPNAARLFREYPYRCQKVLWADTPATGEFQCTLKIVADQEAGVAGDIMTTIGNFKASVRSFNASPNARTGEFEISLKILVPSNMELDKIISQIGAVKHVIKVRRQ